MTLELTKKQTLILEFITDFTKQNNYSPSYREIMTGLNLSSVSAVAEHIDNLVAKGTIKKVPGAARSLEVIVKDNSETIELFKSRFLTATPEERETLIAAAKILELDL